jgi:chromate transporter
VPQARSLSEPGTEPAERPSLLTLGWALLCIGAVAFGGLGATLALLHRELVERRSWLRASDLSEALAYTKPLPGSTVLQVVTFGGYRIAGWAGATVATIMFVLPACAMMTAAAALLFALPDAAWVDGALTGLQVAVVGLLAMAMWQLARSEAGSVRLLIVLAAAFAAGLWINAAVIVAAAGVVGIVLDRAAGPPAAGQDRRDA